jgi:hypothetical protein
MKATQQGPGIFWMVRLLGALGFVMVSGAESEVLHAAS